MLSSSKSVPLLTPKLQINAKKILIKNCWDKNGADL